MSQGEEENSGDNPQPLMLVFAGPNGSGKSTINAQVLKDPELGFNGKYINADEIAKGLEAQIPDYRTRNIKAAGIAEAQRLEALQGGQSFAFESVMSTPEKVALLTQAREHGYQVALIFVTTDNPELNVARVSNRVSLGGHAVEPDSIRKRYAGAMQLLPSAVEHSDTAVVFDNSGVEPVRVVTKDGPTIVIEPNAPQWVQTHFAEPFQARQDSLNKLAATAQATNPKTPIAEAAAAHGRSYHGLVLAQTDHHALQATQDTFTIHDKVLSLDRGFRSGYTTFTYAFDKGKLASEETVLRIEREARGKAFTELPREEALKRHPELASSFKQLDAVQAQIQVQDLNARELAIVMNRVRENMGRAIEKGVDEKTQVQAEVTTSTSPSREAER
ncbi:MAG: zeta toxin family protein [Bacteroidetes bacterium]|nr:zeta toxin family protein [Bacteroidota bacterium]